MPGINGSSNCPTCGSGYCHILGENPQVGTNGKLGIRVREDCDQIFFFNSFTQLGPTARQFDWGSVRLQ